MAISSLEPAGAQRLDGSPVPAGRSAESPTEQEALDAYSAVVT